MEKMDDNTKNILYPKGSIFRILKDDIISAEFKIVKGAIAEAVSDIEVNDKYAEVCCNGETFVIETDIMDIILTKDPIENKSVKNDIIDVIDACIDGKLDQIDLQFEDNAAVCVVLASDGYPEHYEKGKLISGLEKFDGKDGYYVFHAGTKLTDEGIVTNGGRVLGVTAKGKDLKEARKNAYEATEWISFENKYMRHDIGKAIDDAK